MTIKGAKQGLLIGDVLLKGEAVVLVLLLEARLPASSGHACHGACDSCCTLHTHTHTHTHMGLPTRNNEGGNSHSSQLELRAVLSLPVELGWFFGIVVWLPRLK